MRSALSAFPFLPLALSVLGFSASSGLEDALANFGEYHIAKYDRDGAVKMRDVISIVRPKAATPERNALYRYMRRGTVDAELLPKLAAKAAFLQRKEFDAEARELMACADATWEVAISHFGRKAAVWNALTLPFMAGMRNLRNLLQVGADEALERMIAMLRNPEQVRRSRQLPFRFYSAYHVVESLHDVDAVKKTRVMDALLEALASSVANLPRLAGTTFVTMDNSASMSSTISAKSTVRRVDVCNLLGAIAHTMCDQAIASVFGEEHAVVPLMRQDSILTNMAKLAGTDVGCSTNAYLAIRHLRETKTRVDRIVLLSDMQCYDGAAQNYDSSLSDELRKYRSSVNPDVFLYSVDLAGYGTSQFPEGERRVAALAGWSERMLEFIPLFEADATQAVERILAWKPRSMQPVLVAESAPAAEADDAGEAEGSAGDE